VTNDPSRRYVSTRRARQAEQTKADIVAAATELFLRHGWRGTTLAAVAAHADVVVDTIYAGFGSKSGLLAAAKNAARDADEAGVPFFERPTFRQVSQGEPGERLARFATLLATLNARTWKLDVVWRDAAAYEPSVRHQLIERELDRRDQFTRVLELLLGAPVDQETVHTIWLLTGSEVYAKLVDSAGLTHEQYTAWLTATLRRQLAG
jgi:AcrR family transcriptional regulator